MEKRTKLGHFTHKYIAYLFEQKKLPCRHCKRELPLSDIVLDTGSIRGYRNECKRCANFIRPRNKQSKELVSNFEKSTIKPEMCEICNKNKATHFDHCHSTNVFRGWLCRACNLGLGFFKDDVTSLENAISYLKNRY